MTVKNVVANHVVNASVDALMTQKYPTFVIRGSSFGFG